MAHFVFINPSTRSSKGATSLALTIPPIGLAYLASAIEPRGHSTEIIDANREGHIFGGDSGLCKPEARCYWDNG